MVIVRFQGFGTLDLLKPHRLADLPLMLSLIKKQESTAFNTAVSKKKKRRNFKKPWEDNLQNNAEADDQTDKLSSYGVFN